MHFKYIFFISSELLLHVVYPVNRMCRNVYIVITVYAFSIGKANAVQTKLYEFIPLLIVITLIFGYAFSEELSDFGASLPSHLIY